MNIKAHYFIILAMFIGLHIHSFNIHVIGDSHAFFCFNNTESGITADEVSYFRYLKDGLRIKIPFHIHWLGSRTMHRVGRDGLAGLNIKKLGVQEGDVAVFLFGEVDVRCHIGRQRDEKGRAQSKVIQALAHSYLKTISDNKNQYKNLTCFVVSVTPPCDRGFNPAYPFYGSLSERVAITRELNSALHEYAQKNDIKFLDIYSMYAQEDGSLGLAVSDGIVHINPKYNYHIKEKLIEFLINERKL